MKPEAPAPGRVEATFASLEEPHGSRIRRFLKLGSLTLELILPESLLDQWLCPALERILLSTPDTVPNPMWQVVIALDREAANMQDLCAWIGSGKQAGIYETLESPDGLLLWERDSLFWFHLNPASRKARVWLADPHQLAPWEKAAPLKSLWHLLARDSPFQVTHGGAVGTEKGGVLLAGAGGAGKSTTALACLQDGLAYLADDYFLLETGPAPRAHQLYTTVKLRPENLHRFESLRSGFTWKEGYPGAKPTLFLQNVCASQPFTSFPLRALVLPKPSGKTETTWSPCPASEAWKALAPSTMSQLPACGPETFAKLTSVAQALPTFHLHAGTDLPRIPAAIREILASQPS
jgi:hypothetical protein